jgi:hypothetical protein
MLSRHARQTRTQHQDSGSASRSTAPGLQPPASMPAARRAPRRPGLVPPSRNKPESLRQRNATLRDSPPASAQAHHYPGGSRPVAGSRRRRHGRGATADMRRRILTAKARPTWRQGHNAPRRPGLPRDCHRRGSGATAMTPSRQCFRPEDPAWRQMTVVATLFLTCGLQGSSKTTLARRLEAERPALRDRDSECLRVGCPPPRGQRSILSMNPCIVGPMR